MKKITALLLAVLMGALVLTSCAPTTEPETGADETTAGPAQDATTAEDTGEFDFDHAKELMAKIPEYNLSVFDGVFNVLTMQGTGNSEAEIWVEEGNTGDPVRDGVFLRNAEVLEKLGIEILHVPSTDVAGAARIDQKSGTYDYDLIMGNGHQTSSLAQSGDLYNFLDLDEVINLDEDWWDPGTLRDCAIANKVYFMNGDINILDNDVTWILLFNKEMIKTYDLAEPYELVRQKKWTLDAFYEMLSVVSSSDNDGDPTNDTYGFITTSGGGLMNFLYTCDVTSVKVTDGEPEIVMKKQAEKIVKILDWCKKAITDGNFTYISDSNPELSKRMFMENQGLFYSEVMSYIVNLRDMETDFGVLPTPLFDESQENYRTHVDAVGSMISIPAKAPDPMATAVVVETMAIASYLHLTPAYYEQTLKRQQSRDYESAEMLDIILKSRTYDIGYLYTSLDLANVFKNLVVQGSSDFVSSFNRKEKSATKALDRIYKAYLGE